VLNFRLFLEVLNIGFLGIATTHIYRFWIKKHLWLRLSIMEIAPRVLLASIISAILVVSGMIVVIILTKRMTFPDITFAFLLNNLFEITMVTLLWSLLYFAFHYLENYKNSEIEKLVWEAAVKDFELKTLKSQLNPHFMFNALNSIRALVEENPDRAKKAITQLSNIFRYSLRSERIESVTLDEEIQTVADYLALEKVRYEERLSYSIDYSPVAGKVEIPPMMIQTLVENGVKHGISKLHEGGTISLQATVVHNKLNIKIINSGHLNLDEMANTKGFGVSNTKHRLHLLYGTDASFTLTNGKDQVTAEIFLPIGSISQ